MTRLTVPPSSEKRGHGLPVDGKLKSHCIILPRAPIHVVIPMTKESEIFLDIKKDTSV